MKPFREVTLNQMMFMDGAMHTRLRSICSAAFTPHRVERVRRVIESLADELISAHLWLGGANRARGSSAPRFKASFA